MLNKHYYTSILNFVIDGKYISSSGAFMNGIMNISNYFDIKYMEYTYHQNKLIKIPHGGFDENN